LKQADLPQDEEQLHFVELEVMGRHPS
jgi:hypothetical protein